MDTVGARLLAARIRAGVRVGTTIVLDAGDPVSGLSVGDRGVVLEIAAEGVVVEWERGFRLLIDPEKLPYHLLTAS